MSENNNQKPNFFSLYQTVGKIEGTVNAIKDDLTVMKKNHEDRLNDCEKDISTMQGKATAFGFIGGAIMSAIGLIISYFGLKK